jgi:Do/DeqQ family serine protease
VVEAVRVVSPAVVNVSSEYQVRIHSNPFTGFGLSPHFDSFFKDFFDQNYQRNMKRSNLGSGVIIDGKRGFVLTNAHVVTRSGNITITLNDEREFRALVVGADPDSDLAVLKIETDTPLPDISMGNSDDLMIGETVIAIGNPFGFSNTVTTGVISALNRSIKTDERVFYNFIQTDASINPGNSGGPLLDINGKLVGINTAIYASAQGIGFAIPINKAKRILSDLIKYGEVVPAWTGIVLQNVDAKLAHYLQIPGKGGVVVRGVERQSPAEKTGIVEGDIILFLNQKPIASLDDYTAVMKGVSAGRVVDIIIWRGGKKKPFKIKTEIYPIENAIPLAYQLLGIKVKDLTVSSQKGVEIDMLDPNSYLSRIGAAPGDIIRQINDQTINNIDDFQKAIVKFRQKTSIVILLERGGRGYYISLTL